MEVICKLGFSRRGALAVATVCAVLLRGAVVPSFEEVNRWDQLIASAR